MKPQPQPKRCLAGVSDANFLRAIAERRRAPKLAADAFVAAVSVGNIEALWPSFDQIEQAGAWPLVFRRCARLVSVSEEMRQAMLRIWVMSGDHLRCEVGDDRLLLLGLRALLPPYDGPPRVLYRGDSMWNRRRRSYGLAWSAEEDTADSFARGIWRTMKGGSVVLRAVAPPEAIICDASLFEDDRYGEAEYLVDRRLLSKIDVIRRYAQTPMQAI